MLPTFKHFPSNLLLFNIFPRILFIKTLITLFSHTFENTQWTITAT